MLQSLQYNAARFEKAYSRQQAHKPQGYFFQNAHFEIHVQSASFLLVVRRWPYRRSMSGTLLGKLLLQEFHRSGHNYPPDPNGI
jgi:hypothetical protein